MADFRKYAVTFAGLACMLGATGVASAQSFSGFSCNASATPFDMRAEGITEQAGDIVLTCTGGTVTPAGTQITQVNITVSLNTNVTSRLIGGSANLTEALLLINEPAPGTQSFCPGATSNAQNNCVQFGLGTGGGIGTNTYNPATPAPGTARYNGVQGTYLNTISTNQITFFGVPIDPPGPAAAGAMTVPTLTLRITNIRANASALGAPTGFSTSAVFETVSTSAGFPINNNVQTVGIVRRGLLQTAVGTPGTFQQCVSRALAGSFSTLAQTINFTEGFATATKLRIPSGGTSGLAVPGAQLNTESQFIPIGTPGYPGGGAVGTADFATRVRISFSNIPSGVTLYVPTTLASNQLAGGSPSETLTLTSSESGSFSAVSASSATNVPFAFAALTSTAGSVVAVYEVTSQSTQSPTTIESFSVPVVIAFTANPSGNSPALGTSSVSVDFAPLSTVITAASSPIPRFVPSSTAANGFSINACAAVLLFPFLTNLAGFDTGIAIANTSVDPFGTLPQSGTCRLNFYGTAQPATAPPTPTIAAGTVYTNLLSTLVPGFQGYMIAQCSFQFAHGFAFITDGFGGPGRGLSQGYLALIIPDPNANGGSRSPSNANYPSLGSGEGLTN